jgi:hypothetical protein
VEELSNMSRRILLLWSCLVGGPGCALHFGAGQQVDWHLSGVGGAVVDPGVRTQIRSELVRELRYRGIKTGNAPMQVEIVGLTHSRAFVEPESRDIGWRSLLTLKAWKPGVDGCEVETKARRVWIGDGSNPALASESRQLAVKNLIAVASQRTLDRLLSNASCR